MRLRYDGKEFRPRRLIEELLAALSYAPKVESRKNKLVVWVTIRDASEKPTVDAVIAAHDHTIPSKGEQSRIDRRRNRRTGAQKIQAAAALTDEEREALFG